MIADEPTTALDVMVQAQVLTLLNELQHELGLAMLFITHDLSVLVEVCDRLAIMYAGKIVEEGPSTAVFGNAGAPVHDGARRRLPGDRRPALPQGAFRTRRGSAPAGLDPSGCSFHPRCPVAFDECTTVVPDLYEAGRATQGGLPARARRQAGVPT